jgi:CheY-like chemotaxis protein
MSDDACALEARACVPCPGKSPARITFTGSRAILVVEDDALCRIMLADHLRSIGYQVVEAANAEEAVRALSSRSKVDLVFSDVELPGMRGFALAVWIRRHHLPTQIVLTSGVGSVTRALTRQGLVP